MYSPYSPNDRLQKATARRRICDTSCGLTLGLMSLDSEYQIKWGSLRERETERESSSIHPWMTVTHRVVSQSASQSWNKTNTPSRSIARCHWCSSATSRELNLKWLYFIRHGDGNGRIYVLVMIILCLVVYFAPHSFASKELAVQWEHCFSSLLHLLLANLCQFLNDDTSIRLDRWSSLWSEGNLAACSTRHQSLHGLLSPEYHHYAIWVHCIMY